MKFHSYRRFASLLLLSLALGLSTASYAQTVATSSELSGTPIEGNAVRVDKGKVPQDFLTLLAQGVKNAGPNVRQGRVEVLAWSADAERVPHIKSQVVAQLKKSGWEYNEKASATISLLTASRLTPTPKGLLGYWVPTSEALLLMWTEMLPIKKDDAGKKGGAPTAPAKNAKPTITKSALTGITFPSGTRKLSGEDVQAESLEAIRSVLHYALPERFNYAPVEDTLEVVEWPGGPTREEFDASIKKAGFASLGFMQDKDEPSRYLFYFVRKPQNAGEVRREFYGVWYPGDTTRMAWAEVKPGNE